MGSWFSESPISEPKSDVEADGPFLRSVQEFCLEEARLPGLVRLGVLETLGVLRACDVKTLLLDCYISIKILTSVDLCR